MHNRYRAEGFDFSKVKSELKFFLNTFYLKVRFNP